MSGNGRARLYQLVSSRLGDELSFEDFCRQFESIYNFDVKRGDLTAEEDQVFRDVFEVVAWYTPVERERRELPTHFTDKPAVESAVRIARRKLGIAVS